MTDTVDKIEPDCLRHVHEFAWEMLQRLDAEGTQQVALLRSEPGFTFPEAPK